jgi:hypothetical protein
MKTLICSRCLSDIAYTDAPGGFDVYDCSWECKNCNRLWLSSDCVAILDDLWIFIRCSDDMIDDQWVII